MSDVRFDPFETDINGLSSLHYAAMGFIEIQDVEGINNTIKHRHAYTYITVQDIPNVKWLEDRCDCSPQVERVRKGYSGRKGCINMLLQAGVDIWQKDKRGRIAVPGRMINDDEFISWWHEKIAKETFDLGNC